MTTSLKSCLLLFCLSLQLYSCRKDVGEADNTDHTFEGKYDCTEVMRSMVLMDSNRIGLRVDTLRHVTVELKGKTNGSYDVSIGNYFVLNTGFSSTHSYMPGCSSGPCPVLYLFPNDSLYLFKKNSNASSSYYYGKKHS